MANLSSAQLLALFWDLSPALKQTNMYIIIHVVSLKKINIS